MSNITKRFADQVTRIYNDVVSEAEWATSCIKRGSTDMAECALDSLLKYAEILKDCAIGAIEREAKTKEVLEKVGEKNDELLVKLTEIRCQRDNLHLALTLERAIRKADKLLE